MRRNDDRRCQKHGRAFQNPRRRMNIDQAHKAVLQMFENSCKIIVNEELSDNEFEFCKKTIYISLEYLESKREAECSE
jgi:hypothetical protein